ncbi:unnamed protein product [Phytomonas sp. EM1]|nr:unnamed protein product [Phytomonas sp. EM1]|eukprot:CCW62812.1 unnamed protein product [Phytomonas sp. isolate EM1]
MNGARKHAEAVGKVGWFLEIGACECEAGGFTLDRLMWEKLLDRLEDASARFSVNSLRADGLSAHAQIMALNHYNKVYTTASSLVPLSLDQWERWKRGLSTLCLGPVFPSPTPSCGADRLSTSTSPVSETRQALLGARDEAFAVNYWGTTWSTEVRLNKIEKACRDVSTISLIEDEELNRDAKIAIQDNLKGAELRHEDMLARLTRLNFSILQRFSLLRFQSEHLYFMYAVIGMVERRWLLDKLLGNCGEKDKEYEEAVESMVRQSFKRDFRIPSSDLASGALLKQYCDFEVENKKERELVAILHDTQKGMEYRVAAEFAQHEAAAVLTPRHGKGGGVEEEHPLVPRSVLDADGSAIADECVAAFRKSSSSSFEACQRRAFGLTLRRLMELEEFPGVLNASRLEFCLHLLQRWLLEYCGRQHRWTACDPFVCPEDSDLWGFLLERHEVLLRWALSSPALPSRGGAAAVLPPSTAPFVARLEVLRAVVWSVVHAWQSYLKVVRDTPAAAPKRCAREGVARGYLRKWFSERVIALFCQAFLNDLHAEFGDGDDSAPNSDVASEGEVVREEARPGPLLENTGALLILESELKLIICDVQQSTYECVSSLWNETRRRLEPLLDEIIDLLMAKSSTLLTLGMLRGMIHAAVRILQRMQVCLNQLSQRSRGGYTSQDRVCIHKLHAHYKRLSRRAPLAEDTLLLNAIFDGWTQLTSLRLGPSSERGVDVQGLLFIYDTGLSAGRASTTPGEGFMDVCCERRRAMKRLAVGLEEGACGAASSPHPSPPRAGIEDNDCIGGRKRPRK